MALGSLATATNVSPMPTARAPTPMRRNVADDVPARCPPSEPCARATCGTNNRTVSSSRAASLPERHAKRRASLLERLSKIHIELGPPHAAAVVRWVGDRAHVRELVEAREESRVVLAVAPAQARAAERIHDVDRVVVEDVRARDA